MSDITHAVAARTLFDGVNLRNDVAVLIRGEQIIGISGRHELSSSVPVQELPDTVWLVPGFIDIQVNGGGDLLFNDAPTPETIQAIAKAHRRFGTTALLPTLISDAPDKMPKALAAVEQAAAVNPSIHRHSSRRAVPVTGKSRRARSARAAATDQARSRSDHGKAKERDAGDARAGASRRGRHCRACGTPAFMSRSAIPWRPTHRPSPPCARV